MVSMRQLDQELRGILPLTFPVSLNHSLLCDYSQRTKLQCTNWTKK